MILIVASDRKSIPKNMSAKSAKVIFHVHKFGYLSKPLTKTAAECFFSFSEKCRSKWAQWELTEVQSLAGRCFAKTKSHKLSKTRVQKKSHTKLKKVLLYFMTNLSFKFSVSKRTISMQLLTTCSLTFSQ